MTIWKFLSFLLLKCGNNGADGNNDDNSGGSCAYSDKDIVVV